MANEREKIHHDLLEALSTARRQVEYLEAALAHNAACLGIGVEREDRAGKAPPGSAAMPDALLRYIGLVESEADMSDYIGSEGHEGSRPRLGPDAPEFLRPDKKPPVSPLVGQLALGHPADAIVFTPPKDDPAPKQGEEVSKRASGPGDPNSPPGARQSGNDAPPCNPLNDFPHLPDADCWRSCTAIHAVNDGIYDWDVLTGSVYRSPRWLELLGPPQEGSPLESLATSFDSSDQDVLRSRLSDMLAGKASRLRRTVRFNKGDGPGWGCLRAVALGQNGHITRIMAVLADITPQRETEIALRKSNESFRSLIEDSPDILARFGPDGVFLYATPNVSRYWAFTSDDVLERRLDDFDSSPSSLTVQNNIATVFATGQPMQEEIVLTSTLVGDLTAFCRFWPEFGPDGSVVSVSVLIRDMTHARRLAENYYALFNNMDDGFILFERLPGWAGGTSPQLPEEFSIVLMNPAFARMFGVNDAKTTGMRLSELMQADAPAWIACLVQVLTQNKPVIQFLHSGVAPGEYDISAYSPEQGRVACIVKDVTELRRIEQEIRLNEARLAALYRLSHMDAAPESRVAHYCLEMAVKLTGSDFGYLYVSSGDADGGGRRYWSRDAKPWGEYEESVGSDDDLPWRGKNDFRFTKGPEVLNMVEDGFSNAFGDDVKVSRYMLAPIAEDDRIVCLTGVANKKEAYSPSDLRQLELFISGMWFHLRRRRNMQALRWAKDEAEAANRAKNEFLANVSHELRTPLNGILGLLQVLQQSALTDEQMEYVNTAAYSSRSLLRIISDILDFSRIEAGIFELAPQLFDFAATVRSALGMFVHPAGHGRVRFSLMLDKNLPKLLVGDDARVRQIIVNLVGNAFKFTQQGEISVECRLLPYCKKKKKCIYLAVRDTGIGIPEDRLEHIFKAFTQLDGSSTRRYAGTGLGLTIVQRLVRLMDGSLVVESAPGEGTVIHCSLPFDEPVFPVTQRSDDFSITPPPVELDLLVVEDDAVNRFTLRTLLKKIGYNPVCVDNGKEALEALVLRNFDCVITDIQMPFMDGMELARRIREGDTASVKTGKKVRTLLGLAADKQPPDTPRSIPTDIPIIALTAHAMEGDRERFLSMGIDYYLAKPIMLTELATVLSHVGALVKNRKPH